MTATLHTDDPVLIGFAEQVDTGGPVAIEGNRTRWDLGGPVDTDARVLRAPMGIVEYIPHEMIVNVRAGTAVSELHSVLAEQGQWTALPERGGTVGGAIAVGENSFRRPAVGDLRSSVLQVRYVSAEGELVASGGPTVKNVSGFDLPRLVTGSLGTLGCIAEVILRTNPIPPATSWFTAPDADPFRVHEALLAPGPILWDGHTTTVMLFGHEVSVQADLAELAAFGSFTPCDEPAPPAGHRWSLRPADLRTLDRHQTGAFIAEIGVGVLHAERSQPSVALAPDVREIHERLKHEFDPTGRLNPGRIVGVR